MTRSTQSCSSSADAEFHVEYMCGESSPEVYTLTLPASPSDNVEVVINCCPNCTDFSVQNSPDPHIIGPTSTRRKLGQNEVVVSGHSGRIPEPHYYETHARRSRSHRVSKHEEKDARPTKSSTSRQLLGGARRRQPPAPIQFQCAPYADSGWLPTADASLSYELQKGLSWRQLKGLREMDARMLSDALNITNQYVAAMGRMAKLARMDSAGQWNFGSLTARLSKPCSEATDEDPCEVTTKKHTGQVPLPVAATSLPAYDPEYQKQLSQAHAAGITSILHNASQTAAPDVPADGDQKQLRCPPIKITSGNFASGSAERPGDLSAIKCGSVNYCVQATACKDGTCDANNCKGAVLIAKGPSREMDPCRWGSSGGIGGSDGSNCLSAEQMTAVEKHTTTIAIATRNMTRVRSGGVSYVASQISASIDMYTVRFWDPQEKQMQCIFVNGSACKDGSHTCPITYFGIDEKTQVLGSLRDAIAGKPVTFHLSMTILNQLFQASVPGKLTAFNQESDIVRDMVGVSSLYLQNNQTCP